MITYPIPMVPGPVRVPSAVLERYLVNYGSGDLELDFLALYNLAEANLQRLLDTRSPIAIQTGEGMICWNLILTAPFRIGRPLKPPLPHLNPK